VAFVRIHRDERAKRKNRDQEALPPFTDFAHSVLSMKLPFRLLFWMVTIPLVCFGRLGETESELSARFGAPASRGDENIPTQGRVVAFGSRLNFRQGDWTIGCSIIEGRCAKEIYSKGGDWTEDQFAAVLTSNSQGEIWTDISKEMTKKMLREWRRGDGGTAIWRMGIGMVVANPAYDRAKLKAENKAKADASQVPRI
jgi:hypothetical protein